MARFLNVETGVEWDVTDPEHANTLAKDPGYILVNGTVDEVVDVPVTVLVNTTENTATVADDAAALALAAADAHTVEPA